MSFALLGVAGHGEEPGTKRSGKAMRESQGKIATVKEYCKRNEGSKEVYEKIQERIENINSGHVENQ